MEDKVAPQVNLESNLSQEPLRRPPNVKYEIYFSPHGTLNDFQGLFKLIKSADIYVTEAHGWFKEYLGVYQDVSAGRKTPEQAIGEAMRVKQIDNAERNPLLLKELQALYETNKPIVFIDLPEEEIPRGKNLIRLAVQSFDELLANVQDFLEEESKLGQKREAHMVEQLKMRVGEILDSYPDLKAKNDVKVLVSLGSVHTGVYYQLKESGERVEKDFNVMPTIYSLSEEGVRRYMWGKPVDEELAARILLETVFENGFQSELEKISTDNTKIDLFKRKVASQFGIDEIRNIFHVLTYTDWDYFKGSFEGNITYLMENKGLKIPQSEQELDDMVKTNQH